MIRSSTHILSLVLLLCSLTVFGQDYPLTADKKLLKNQPEAVERLRPILEKALDDYERYAVVVNPETFEIDDESKKNFYALFDKKYEDRILLDFYTRLEDNSDNPSEYIHALEETSLYDGVLFELVEKQIVSIVEEGGRYEVQLRVNKKFDELYNESSGRTDEEVVSRPLLLHYYVYPEDDPPVAKIHLIRSADDIQEYELPQRYISAYLGTGTASWSPQMSDYWERTHLQSDFDVESGLGLKLGVEMMTTKFLQRDRPHKRVGFIVGLNYSSATLTTSLLDLRLNGFDVELPDAEPGPQASYRREVQLQSVEEDLRLSSIDLSLGLGYRLNKKDTYLSRRIFLNLKVVPMFSFASSAETLGVGDFDARLYRDDGEISEHRLLSLQAVYDRENGSVGSAEGVDDWRMYDIGLDQAVVGESDPSRKTFGLRLELSPTIYFDNIDKTEEWSLMLGLDIGYQFSSPLDHSTVSNVAGESYHFREDVSESLLNQYTDDLHGLIIGLRIGVHQRTDILH